MKKYEVHLDVRGTIVTEVEANSMEEAEENARNNADIFELEVYNVEVADVFLMDEEEEEYNSSSLLLYV